MLIQELIHNVNTGNKSDYYYTHHFSECGDDFAESREGLVDVCPLLESCALGPRGVGTLGPRQVYKADL